MSKPKLTKEEASLYNELLALNWDNAYIELSDILYHTKGRQMGIAYIIEALEAKGFLLVGLEYHVLKELRVTTFTPITKSGAYGYPAEDDFKDYNEWMQNAVEVSSAV